MILEMEYGGKDLETFKLESPEQIKAIILQLCQSLKLAEEECKFEHRDLYK